MITINEKELTDEKINELEKNYNPNYLILVNKDKKIEENYIDNLIFVNAKGVKEIYQIELNTYLAYKELEKELEKEKIYINFCSAYRSLERQKKVMDFYTKEKGKEYAEKIVAKVGHSEHHTGLALDIVFKKNINDKYILDNEILYKEVEIFKSIHKKLHEYGFIYRYQKEKENITKQQYEPWHIRFVTKKHAKNIYENNLSLEEYEEYLEKNK